MQHRSRLLLLGTFLMIYGCSSDMLTRVKPYEREFFADPKMQYGAFEARGEHEGHVLLIREASAGGESTFQGGCGCR